MPDERLERVVIGIRTVRRMCTDEEPYPKIDAKLAEIEDEAAAARDSHTQIFPRHQRTADAAEQVRQAVQGVDLDADLAAAEEDLAAGRTQTFPRPA